MTNSDLGTRIAALLLMLATVVGGHGAEAMAEESPIPGLGSRVRVTPSSLSSGPLAGTLTGVEAKSLAVQAKGRSEAVVLDRQDIRRLEWSVRPGRKKKGALLGLGIGFGVGFVGTVALCAAFGEECPGGEGVVYGAIYGAAAGVFGAGVGALVAPSERWAEVPLDRIRTGGRGGEPRPASRLSLVVTCGSRRGLTLVTSF